MLNIGTVIGLIKSSLTGVKNAINGMNPVATASDIGKALLVKTVADGKPTSWEYGEAGGGSVDPSAIAQAEKVLALS